MAEQTATQIIRPVPLLTIRIPEVVGRADVIEKITAARRALESQRGTSLLCVIGEGGVGKTRLLEAIMASEACLPNELIADKLVDFYDAEVHSELELASRLLQSINNRCSEEDRREFDEFRSLLARYRTQEAGAVATDLREKVKNAFFEAWARVTRRRPCVVFMDTGERLGYLKQFGLGDIEDLPQARVLDWLQEAIRDDAQLSRTLVVLACRPRPDDLVQNLRKMATEARVIELGGLSPEGIDEYFEQLRKALESKGNETTDSETKSLFVDAASSVGRLQEMGKHQLLGKITGGSPVAMSMAAQLYLDGGGPRDALEEMFDSAQSLAASREVLRNALVNGLLDYTFGDVNISDPLQFLALMRKGMTAERLHAVWYPDKAGTSKIDEAGLHERQRCREVIEYLRQQSFVKTLPDNSIVLHDEIADWIDGVRFESYPVATKKIYERLNTVYDRELKACENEIARLSSVLYAGEVETDRRKNFDETELMRIAETTEEVSESQREADNALLTQRYLRRKLCIERMYYALRWNPLEGYKQHNEIQEEVFNSNAHEYAAQSLTEFVRWWEERSILQPENSRNQAEAAQAGISPSMFAADLALREVQRIFDEKKREAIRRAELALETEPLRNTPLLAETLRIYRAAARGALTANSHEARQIEEEFKQIVTRLRNNQTQDNALLAYLVKCALAFAHYERGFYENILGKHGNAVIHYGNSRPLYEALSLEICLARTINDIAYSMALIGWSGEALSNVEDGLQFRQRLGFGRSIAFSLNTRASILATLQRPISAIYSATKALAIFRRLEDIFGETLALRTCAEAWRRNGNVLSDHGRRRLTCYIIALDFAQQAVQKAQHIDEPDFKADVFDELACVYRGLAFIFAEQPGLFAEDVTVSPKYQSILRTLDPKSFVSTADEWFAQALVSAGYVRKGDIGGKEDLFVRRKIDIIINRAYLHYFTGNDQRAAEIIDEVSGNPLVNELCDSTSETYKEFVRTSSQFWYYLVKLFTLKLRRTPDDDEVGLLTNSLWVLHFIRLIGGQRQLIQDSSNYVHDRLKKLSPQKKLEFATRSVDVAKSFNFPPESWNVLRQFMERNMSVRVGSSEEDE
jgi:hypothetical protein